MTKVAASRQSVKHVFYALKNQKSHCNITFEYPLHMLWLTKVAAIVLPGSNDHVYICLFVNIEIKALGWHIQQSGVVLKTI